MKSAYIHVCIRWNYGPLALTGPLPKIGRWSFISIESYSKDEISLHTKFYQNRLKNIKVMTMFLPPQTCGKFVWKYEILKFGGIQFSPPDDIGFPQRCSLLRLLGSYNVCLDNLGPKDHLFHEIYYPMLSHTCEDRLKTIKFVWKYEISKFPQLSFSWTVNITSSIFLAAFLIDVIHELSTSLFRCDATV